VPLPALPAGQATGSGPRGGRLAMPGQSSGVLDAGIGPGARKRG
jgi:hypothetical protein